MSSSHEWFVGLYCFWKLRDGEDAVEQSVVTGLEPVLEGGDDVRGVGVEALLG
ncbi:hypothetical protein COLO4_03603 [Corchorus olitorius]|uniref:Uncharacterized protein n=1 Tax=Corchorus olitorius TaxID=93759 RepID=A0A1R3KXZ1_9ROSI|nr:hypothetical protein COLO4_03603 [Corchorus olitorius]